MDDQEIRVAALISAELHIGNELETNKLSTEKPISGYILNKLLACFADYIEKGENIPEKTYEYRIDPNTIGIKSDVSLIDLLLSKDRHEDPI
jgi:hypothetical protein